ncbi:MAG: hypothetical protein QW706_09750 [Candidatus Nezhaarchaeales archaeon]
MVKTIKLKDETYKALTMVLGELTADCGKRLTFDDVIKTLVDLWFRVGRKQMIRGIPTDNVATKGKGRVGPFIAGLYSAAVASAEAAIRLMKEKEGKLRPEDIAYLKHVIREGKIAKRFLEEHGIHVKSPLLDSYQLDEEVDQSSTAGQS